MIGPQCGSSPIKKNGSTHHNKRKYQCNDGGRQLVENPQNKIIDEETKELIDRLLLETIPLAKIARVVDVSERWLPDYVNKTSEPVHPQIEVTEKPKGPLRSTR